VFFRQVLHADLGCASYVVADTDEGVGAVVDPKWEIAEYLDLARSHGFRIAHVIETHNHADHLSGRGRLVETTGAQVWIHRLAEATYDHVGLEDGDEIAIGAVRLHFRPTDTAAATQVIEQAAKAELSFIIPGREITGNWDLQYFFEILNADGGGWFAPDPLTATPYWVVHVIAPHTGRN